MPTLVKVVKGHVFSLFGERQLWSTWVYVKASLSLHCEKGLFCYGHLLANSAMKIILTDIDVYLFLLCMRDLVGDN